MKKYIPSETAATAIAMAAALFFSGVISAAQCRQELCEDMVRLHILAASDSEYDQNMKLAVRDGILAASPDIFAPYSTADEARQSLTEHCSDIEKIAEEILHENGCDKPVTCSLEITEFDEREYGSYTVPAGEYTALRVVIGEGEGHNWWCVMYPPLCVPCACAGMTDEEIMEQYGGELSDEEISLITYGGEFKARLYIADLIGELFKEKESE